MKKLSAFSRLGIGILLMSFFAVLEYWTGEKTYLTALQADSLNMLGHSLIMFVAFAVAVIHKVLNIQHRKIEVVGAFISCIFLLVMAGNLAVNGMNAHHAGINHSAHTHYIQPGEEIAPLDCGPNAQNSPLQSPVPEQDSQPYQVASNAWLLSLFAVMSFVLHSFIVWFLYKGEDNINVMGACMNMSIHVFMTVLMFISGLLMQMFGWLWLNDALVYLIVALMVYMAWHLANKALAVWNSVY